MIRLLFSTLSLMLMVWMPASVTAQQIFPQDLKIGMTTTRLGMGNPGEQTSEFTNYYSKNAMRTISSDRTDMIVRFDSRKIVMLNNKDKQYTEITFQQIQELLNKLQTEAAPDEDGIEKMRKMMGQLNSGASLVKKGLGETIAGYATEKYELTGPVQMELWVAPGLKIPETYYDVLKLLVPATPLFDSGYVYDELKKIDCMALKTVISVKMMDMEMHTTTLVNYVEKAPLPASMFEIPAGYRLVQK